MLSDLNVWMLLLAHSLLSLLAGLVSTLLMPPQYRSSPRRTFTHHSVMSFFIPVLGALALMLLAIYARAINLLHQERALHYHPPAGVHRRTCRPGTSLRRRQHPFALDQSRIYPRKPGSRP